MLVGVKLEIYVVQKPHDAPIISLVAVTELFGIPTPVSYTHLAAVSAVTIANKIYVLVRNIILGIGQGFQPVAGYNYSAGKRRRAWRAFVFASVLGSAVCIASAAVIAAFSTPIMRWFCDDAEVARIGTCLLYTSRCV